MCKHRFCNVRWCIANHFLCSVSVIWTTSPQLNIIIVIIIKFPVCFPMKIASWATSEGLAGHGLSTTVLDHRVHCDIQKIFGLTATHQLCVCMSQIDKQPADPFYLEVPTRKCPNKFWGWYCYPVNVFHGAKEILRHLVVCHRVFKKKWHLFSRKETRCKSGICKSLSIILHHSFCKTYSTVHIFLPTETKVSFLTPCFRIPLTMFMIPCDTIEVFPEKKRFSWILVFRLKIASGMYSICMTQYNHIDILPTFRPFPKHEITASWPSMASATLSSFKASPMITSSFPRAWGGILDVVLTKAVTFSPSPKYFCLVLLKLHKCWKTNVKKQFQCLVVGFGLFIIISLVTSAK